MVTEILVVVFIAALLGYIIFLHIQLAKKNIFIESTVRRPSGIEKSWNAEEMMRFLLEMKKVSYYSSFFTDKLFEEKPMRFLLENEKDVKIYIHYTKEENDAKNILKEGFRFADSFYKTALPVTNDKLDLLIKHNGRKSFGKYLIILCLSDKIVDHYSAELNKKGLKSYFVENVLTVAPPFRNENADIVYQLSNKFVKGFINYQTGEITRNPDYDPLYDSPVFEKNLELLKQKNLN
ncbi:MAG: hypothetical protein NTZ85_11775 [Bacteroidia bacterium]|nr:hypothetical protein [Bacteroidia bacterium]